MENTYDQLARRAIGLLESSQRYRVIILVIGAPGSGKSTLSAHVVDRINEIYAHSRDTYAVDTGSPSDMHGRWDELPNYDPIEVVDIEDDLGMPRAQRSRNKVVLHGRGSTIEICQNTKDEKSLLAQVIPMDGFHLPMKTLKQFKDPDRAILRRGSPFTFDSGMIVTLVEILNDTCVPLSEAHGVPDIYIPNFDHALKDPTLNGIKIASGTRILLIEGLYLLLKQQPWNRIHDILSGSSSEFWRLKIERERARQRVAKRHVASGICPDLESGRQRYELNDGINGELVDATSYPCHMEIESIDELTQIC